jgi:hypothetical protein
MKKKKVPKVWLAKDEVDCFVKSFNKVVKSNEGTLLRMKHCDMSDKEKIEDLSEALEESSKKISVLG